MWFWYFSSNVLLLNMNNLFRISPFHYTSTKSWRGYIFTAVCLCVCLSVCVSCSACEQNSSQTDAPIWMRFLLNGCLPHWLDPIEIGEHGSKVKVTVTQYPFFYNSLSTSLLYISALLCLIKLKFGMSLRYALWRFVLEFQKNRMDYVSFLQTFFNISISIETTIFILGTNIQQH